jgi:hypothetical protein
MFLGVWVMGYLVETKYLPLVLGGDDVKIQGMRNASFGTMEEKKSIKSHLVKTNEKSGAIFANASVIKNTVSSVWEAELMAASDAIDTIKYLQNVGRELMYPIGSQCSLKVDNKSVVNWMNISLSSKHAEIKLKKVSQLKQLDFHMFR